MSRANHGVAAEASHETRAGWTQMDERDFVSAESAGCRAQGPTVLEAASEEPVHHAQARRWFSIHSVHLGVRCHGPGMLPGSVRADRLAISKNQAANNQGRHLRKEERAPHHAGTDPESRLPDSRQPLSTLPRPFSVVSKGGGCSA